MNRLELSKRYLIFCFALFFSALGVSIITQSNLGTSPISSMPYVFSLNTPFSMGAYIFILNMVLILIQMWMLGKRGILDKKIDLAMQIPVSLVFAFFIDFTMWMLGDLIPQLYYARVLSLIVGCSVLAFGICLEVVADVTMVSGEYTVQIAAKKFNQKFGNVKIMFDVILVVLAVIGSWILARRIDGIREGTIIAALVTGPFVKIFLPRLRFIERWEREKDKTEDAVSENNYNRIITISREYGSGGHVIGKAVAKKLGISFYDKEIISFVAKEGNFSEDFISKKEQNLPNNLLYHMVMQDYEAPLEKSLSSDDAIFVAEGKVIRKLASEGPCVIIGRCANYILSDYPANLNVFLHSDMEHKIDMLLNNNEVVNNVGAKKNNLSKDDLIEKIKRKDKARKDHYYHYTGNLWGDSHNYNLTLNTSDLSVEKASDIIISMYNN